MKNMLDFSNPKWIKIYNSTIQKTLATKLIKYSLQNNIDMYNKYLVQSKNHLEIGTASMDELIKSKSNTNMKISLLDFVQPPLDYAQQSLVQNGFNQENIESVCCDILKLDSLDNPFTFLNNEDQQQSFDSIAMFALLHCVPSPMNEKLPKIIDNLSNFMDENTYLFGTTFIMAPEKSLRNSFVKYLRKNGPLFNEHDAIEDIEEVLNRYFNDVNVKKIGYFACFEATKMK